MVGGRVQFGLVVLAVALVLVGAAEASGKREYKGMFNAFITQHGKSYAHDEFKHRYDIFKRNVAYIDAHNMKNLSFTLGLNQFADLEVSEFNKIYKGLFQRDVVLSDRQSPVEAAAPAAIDWRQKGVVSEVKNQGQCGSCWSFSTTGAVEASRAINTGYLISLSEQQLIDCSVAYGNNGCNGGIMERAMQYIIDNRGVVPEAIYPYTMSQGPCRYQPSACVTDISGHSAIASGDEVGLFNAVGTVGPVSVAIDASHPSFQFYSSGVYYEPQCSPTVLDHGVLVVGYDTDVNGIPYWIVKNSWGPTWGQAGYIWMPRFQNNYCGIATNAVYPFGGMACPSK